MSKDELEDWDFCDHNPELSEEVKQEEVKQDEGWDFCDIDPSPQHEEIKKEKYRFLESKRNEKITEYEFSEIEFFRKKFIEVSQLLSLGSSRAGLLNDHYTEKLKILNQIQKIKTSKDRYTQINLAVNLIRTFITKSALLSDKVLQVKTIVDEIETEIERLQNYNSKLPSTLFRR